MASSINSALKNCARSYFNTPISEILYNAATNVTSPSLKGFSKASYYAPINVFVSVFLPGAILYGSAEFAYMFYKTDTLKSKLKWGALALGSFAFASYELIKFKNVLSCFSSFDCITYQGVFFPSESQCNNKAEEEYYKCSGIGTKIAPDPLNERNLRDWGDWENTLQAFRRCFFN